MNQIIIYIENIQFLKFYKQFLLLQVYLLTKYIYFFICLYSIKVNKKLVLEDPIYALKIGQEANITKLICEEDVTRFSLISGDFNPIHFDNDFASKSIFKKPIAHGFISASLFSGLFGSKLPGPGSLYISQNLKFPHPVFIGDKINASVKISDINLKRRWINFSTNCINEKNKKIVVKGQATIYLLPINY